jgi:hypothetical protein
MRNSAEAGRASGRAEFKEDCERKPGTQDSLVGWESISLKAEADTKAEH